MIQFKVPKKFVSIISLIFSVLNFFSASGSCIPAQNTQISIVWNFSIISWKTFLALDSSFTSRGNEKIFELLVEYLHDLKIHGLEVRIEELESKFSKDLSETTFNEIKDLKEQKKKQNIN